MGEFRTEDGFVIGVERHVDFDETTVQLTLLHEGDVLVEVDMPLEVAKKVGELFIACAKGH